MLQSLYVRRLTEEEERALAQHAHSSPKSDAWRARVILMSAQGKTSAEISKSLGFHISNVKKWIRKFNEEGLAGLAAKKRGPKTGPKPMFNRSHVERILALAGTSPSAMGLPFKKWTPQKLAAAAMSTGVVDSISHVTVRQMLKRGGAPGGESGADAVRDVRPGAVRASYDLGVDAFKRSDFKEAVARLSASLADKPLSADDEAVRRCLLSQALGELIKYEDAYKVIEQYEGHVALQPLSPVIRARVKLRIGAAYAGLKNYPKAIATLNDAKKLFLELQDELGISETHYNLGKSYAQINEFRIARDHLETAVQYQKTVQNRELLARIYDKLGFVDFGEGAFSSSYEKFQKALEYARDTSNPNLMGMILLNIGTTYDEGSLGSREKSSRYFQQAVEYLQRGGQKDLLAYAYQNLSDNLRKSGHWDEAILNLDKALEISDQYAGPDVRAMAQVTRAEILCARGAFAEAESRLNESLRLTVAHDDKWLESYVLRVLGSVHIGQGKVEDALKALRQALRLSTSTGDLHAVTLAQIGLAEAHLQQGGSSQAREYLELAQGRLKEEESLFISGLIQRLAGLLEAKAGRFAEARQHSSQSISVFTTTDLPYEIAKSHYAMGRILLDESDLGGALNHLVKAKGVFEELSAGPELDETLRDLSRVRDAELPGKLSTKAGSKEPDEGRRSSILDSLQSGMVSLSAGDDRNDVLLMQRLIEASASRDLLLQELASVIMESFPVSTVIVYLVDEDGRSEPVISEGISLIDLDTLSRTLNPLLFEDGGSAPDAHIFRLGVIDRDSLGPARGGRHAAIAVYVRFQSDQSTTGEYGRILSRLQPLLKQAELGIEMCSLRAASRISVYTSTQHRAKTVMPGFIVGSPSMFDVIDKIHKIRTSDVTVLITGESGTGKELVARAVHKESARAGGIFLPFNCTATPRDLIDSQLFGHKRGSFTGAITNYPGITRAADGGTLFLDEIGDLALEVQPKLMRFLQEGEIQPLGETKPVKVDVRVLAATNSDLERAVEEGRFREDLFHRLNIIRIHVPPLRDRREEIPILASHFLEHFCSRSGKHGIAFSEEAVAALSDYDWPGNVRQLRNEIERAVAYATEGARVSLANLSPEITGPRRQSGPLRHPNSQYRGGLEIIGNGARAEWYSDPLRGAATTPAPLEPHLNGVPVKLRDATSVLEKEIITNSLARNRNNLSRTAQELGLSRRGLRLKLAQLRIMREPF